MSNDAGEVSWQTLRRIVQQWSGDGAELDAVSSLDGGSISTTLLLHTKSGDQAVLKLSPHRVDRAYEVEAHQLGLLGSLGLPVPKVYGCKVASLDMPDSYLLIEYKPGVNLHDARERCPPEEFDRLQAELADVVVRLHKQTSGSYGKVEPQTPSGTARAANGASWPRFYRSLYDEIWHECEKHSAIPAKTRKLIGRIHERLEGLVHHNDEPRLTHGDLWTSNVLAYPDQSGRWRITALLDPHCRYAHAECELAYLDLFHTVTQTFMKTYHQSFKTDDEYYSRRKHVYQLYELLNHVNFFGDRYIKPLQASLEKLSAFV